MVVIYLLYFINDQTISHKCSSSSVNKGDKALKIEYIMLYMFVVLCPFSHTIRNVSEN